MSTDKDRDAERAARFMEDLAADAEEERILGLSDEELIAEMRREGRDPSRVPSPAALLARVKAQAEAEGRLRPTEAVKEEPVQGPAKAMAATIETSGRVLAPWRRPWRALGALAAAAAVAVTLGTTMMMHVEAPLGSIPHARAAELRRAALEKCGAADWKECKRLLDEAARMDPAGEQETSVKKAREAIAKAGQ